MEVRGQRPTTRLLSRSAEEPTVPRAFWPESSARLWRQACALIPSMVACQALMVAHVDNFKFLGLSALCRVPLACLLEGGKPAGEVHVR
jgi:hypothetical protein